MPLISDLLNKRPNERTLRDHLESIGPHLVERAPDQFRADALATEFGRHFGMDEGNDVAVDLVVGRRDMAVDRQFIAVLRLVIDDVAHPGSSASDQPFSDSSSMPRIDHASPSADPLMSSIFQVLPSRTKS